jgi:retron-type reverse transcriptase
VTKVLAKRLGPELDNLVSINQAAFIRKRCIHDNFMYVQEVIKNLHKRKILSLFIKLDIAKAFDSINWSYLLQIMSHLSFGKRWTN